MDDRGATDRKKAHKEDKTKQSKSISLQMGDKERRGTMGSKKGRRASSACGGQERSYKVSDVELSGKEWVIPGEDGRWGQVVRAGRVEKYVNYSMPILINKCSSTQLKKKL